MNETAPDAPDKGIEQLANPLELLKVAGLYDWLSSWPDWLLYVLVPAVVLMGPAIKKSYRDFAVKKLSALCRWLKPRLSLKSLAAEKREKRRVRRIRKRGRLERGERMSRAEKILPYLNGPDAEKLLRRHAARLSDSFMDTRRIGHGSSVMLTSFEIIAVPQTSA